MDWGNLPEWLKLAVAGALSSLGTMILAVFKARSDDKRIRTDDRTMFTTQVMDRLSEVESLLVQERKHCEDKIAQVQTHYESRLKARDHIITELRHRIEHLENLNDGGGK